MMIIPIENLIIFFICSIILISYLKIIFYIYELTSKIKLLNGFIVIFLMIITPFMFFNIYKFTLRKNLYERIKENYDNNIITRKEYKLKRNTLNKYFSTFKFNLFKVIINEYFHSFYEIFDICLRGFIKQEEIIQSKNISEKTLVGTEPEVIFKNVEYDINKLEKKSIKVKSEIKKDIKDEIVSNSFFLKNKASSLCDELALC